LRRGRRSAARAAVASATGKAARSLRERRTSRVADRRRNAATTSRGTPRCRRRSRSLRLAGSGGRERRRARRHARARASSAEQPLHERAPVHLGRARRAPARVRRKRLREDAIAQALRPDELVRLLAAEELVAREAALERVAQGLVRGDDPGRELSQRLVVAALEVVEDAVLLDVELACDRAA